jgi:hypothetical protein
MTKMPGNACKKMKTKNAQSVLEYTLIIAVAVSALIAMSTYVRRGIQANLKLIEHQVNGEEPLTHNNN